MKNKISLHFFSLVFAFVFTLFTLTTVAQDNSNLALYNFTAPKSPAGDFEKITAKYPKLFTPGEQVTGINELTDHQTGSNILFSSQTIYFGKARERTVVNTSGQVVAKINGVSFDCSALTTGTYLITPGLFSESPTQISVINGSVVGYKKTQAQTETTTDTHVGDIDTTDDVIEHQLRSGGTWVPRMSGNLYLAKIVDVPTGYYYDNEMIIHYQLEHRIDTYEVYNTPNPNMRIRFKNDTLGGMCPATNWGAKTFEPWALYSYDPITHQHYWNGLPITVSYVMVDVPYANLPDSSKLGVLMDVDGGLDGHIQLTLCRYDPEHVVSCDAENPQWKPSDGEEYKKWVYNAFGPVTSQFDLACKYTTATFRHEPMLNGIGLNNTAVHPGGHSTSWPIDSIIYDYAHRDHGGICGEHACLNMRTASELDTFKTEMSSIANYHPNGNGHAQTMFRVEGPIYMLDATCNTHVVDSLGNPVDVITWIAMAAQGRWRELHFVPNTTLNPFLGLGPCEFLSTGFNIPGISYVEEPLPGNQLFRYYAVNDIYTLAKQDCYQEIAQDWNLRTNGRVPLYDGNPENFTQSILWLHDVSAFNDPSIWAEINAALLYWRGIGLLN